MGAHVLLPCEAGGGLGIGEDLLDCTAHRYGVNCCSSGMSYRRDLWLVGEMSLKCSLSASCVSTLAANCGQQCWCCGSSLLMHTAAVSPNQRAWEGTLARTDQEYSRWHTQSELQCSHVQVTLCLRPSSSCSCAGDWLAAWRRAQALAHPGRGERTAVSQLWCADKLGHSWCMCMAGQ